MEKQKIIDSLDIYFDSPTTDYAIMICGEWGIGKTYFLKNDVFKKIKEYNLRPIYISLIGLNNDVQLEKLILQKVNPFYNSTKKSILTREAEYIESIINGEDLQVTNIPKNLVLCFDDLERIKPDFFQTAMGFINIFIEHHKTKCIFLCNEQHIFEKENKFRNYKTIKEKYIRFTYSFNPILETVIKEKVSSLEFNHDNNYDIPLILELFSKGETSNLRTLFFVLDVFEQLLNEVDKLLDKPKHINRIIKLVLTYCCYYTIESKRGTPLDILDKITISYAQNNWNIDDENFELLSEYNIGEEAKPSDDISGIKVKEIQHRYFSNESIQFERFESVAEFIKSGYLNIEKLKSEIETLDEHFALIEKDENKNFLINKIDNPYLLSDSEFIPTIKSIIKEVETGTYNLQTYLKLYSQLIWWESCGITGIKVTDEITNSFKKGVLKASRSGELKYIPNLLFQSQWNQRDKSNFAKKNNEFAAYVDSFNKHLNAEKLNLEFVDIIDAITKNKYKELQKIISEKTEFHFNQKSAVQVYNVLNIANAATTNSFLDLIIKRYKDSGGLVSQMVHIEKEFITTLHEVLEKDKNLNPNVEKPLSKLPIMFLKNHLENIMENNVYYRNERKKNEE